MKKFKLLAFVAMALVAVFALSSCGTVGNFNKIFNEEYDFSADAYKTVTKISDLKDYTAVNGNDTFVVFDKADSDGNVKTVVYSLITNSIVKTVESDDDIVYSVGFLSYGVPVCVITSTTVVDAPNPDEWDTGDYGDVEEPTVTKTYYDATGKELLSVNADAEAGEPKVLYGSDYIVINAGVYKVDAEAGSVESVKEIPAYVSVDGLYGFNGEYFYAVADSSIIIYDADFAPVATYAAPSYAENMNEFVLNNGNVLVQYTVALAEDAMFYDFLEDGVKYNLVTKVLTVKGKEKTLPLNYFIEELMPNSYFYDEEAEENEFTDKFENIAVIKKIKNHKVDEEEANWDIVMLNNNGMVGQSLKVVEGQYAEIPEKIGEDLFMVETVYGSAMIDSKGNVKFQITNSDVEVYGKYIIATNAIYDLSFTKIYDLGANDATIQTRFSDTIFVKAGEDDDYSYIMFDSNGNQKTIYTYDDDEEIYCDIIPGLGYVIYERDDDVTEYEYFAIDGVKLIETEACMNMVATGSDCMIVSVTEDEKTNFYVIKK